jgi:BetR domain
MTTGELQQQLFKAIKSKMGEGLSMADEIAKLLDISTDSAYRRMRGEKTVTLDELQLLCSHYQVSLDQLMNVQAKGIVFQGQYLDKTNFRFEEYITSMMHNMAYMNSFKEKRFYYLCKDLPIFHQYHIREIAAFKWFFYLKTYFQFPGFEKRKFKFSDHPDELFELERKVLDLYNQIPSIEIWNLENMNIFFRQIEFYRDGQVFESDKDVYTLYEAIEKLWSHLEQQASLGYKFNYGDTEKKPIGEFKMYFNEVLLGDNNMLVELDGTKMSYLSHTTINFMLTKDEAFNTNMYNHIQNQMKRSTLISEVSEKERARFFRIIREKIIARKQSLKV